MRLGLEEYRNLKICVAVSGGRDSMALLHYLLKNGERYGISVCALNCDHGMRASSSSDSRFVENYCRKNGVKLLTFKWDTAVKKTENSARIWRHECYLKAVSPHGIEWQGADAVATAHHLNDNAETVLFNLARGSALSGLTGISDSEITAPDGRRLKIIRPLIATSRTEIDDYIAENNVPYVDDETNFSGNYTRNKIRLKVLPELESAVPDAASAIYRFSRLAADDEEYFAKIIEERKLLYVTPLGAEIQHCDEKVLFKRAAFKALREFNVKDYTSEQLQTLYNLQFAEKGKRFEFLNLTAFKEEGRVAIIPTDELFCSENCLLETYIKEKRTRFGGQPLMISAENDGAENLKFDFHKIPRGAVVRTMREGDKFKKFGGGTKNLGDFFTDKKLPVRLRGRIPLIACGSEILAVCGVEISDKIKVDDGTTDILYISCNTKEVVNGEQQERGN